MRDTLNMKIKFREGFRPFAPSVLADKAARVVRHRLRQPVHAAGGQVREGKRVIPSVTHVDDSARLQTVTREREPALLRPDRGVREDHRRAHRHQHVVQRARRAHRLHAPRRLPVLHAHEHGPAGAGPLPPRQEGAAAAARGRGLAHAVRARLRGASRMAFEESREKLGIIGELWAFMRVRKKWWLGPIVLMLALLGPAGGLHPGLGGGALHLHAVLIGDPTRGMTFSAQRARVHAVVTTRPGRALFPAPHRLPCRRRPRKAHPGAPARRPPAGGQPPRGPGLASRRQAAHLPERNVPPAWIWWPGRRLGTRGHPARRRPRETSGHRQDAAALRLRLVGRRRAPAAHVRG